MASTILNASTVALNLKTGTVPDVGGALRDWFQPMVFTQVVKTTVAFQLVETTVSTNFWGTIQPYTATDLQIKDIGERSWNWYLLHADPSLSLDVDEVVTYNGVNMRVMGKKDYSIYGYVEYSLIQDWMNATPPPVTTDYDGGTAFTTVYDLTLDGGTAFTTGTDVIDGGNAFAD